MELPDPRPSAWADGTGLSGRKTKEQSVFYRTIPIPFPTSNAIYFVNARSTTFEPSRISTTSGVVAPFEYFSGNSDFAGCSPS